MPRQVKAAKERNGTSSKVTPPAKPVKLHGHYGLWQLESWCELCGRHDRHGAPRRDRPDDMLAAAAEEWPVCDHVYMGRPGNRCGWPKSFGWSFVPLEQR